MGALARSIPLLVTLTLGAVACKSDTGPPVPASSHPEGADLVVGAVVLADDTHAGGVRIYKVKEVQWFPPPMTEELVMLVFKEKATDYVGAAKLWKKRDLTVEIAEVRIQRHMFRRGRDYRVLAVEPVTDAERALKRDQKLPRP
jgi:hypothetical protein